MASGDWGSRARRVGLCGATQMPLEGGCSVRKTCIDVLALSVARLTQASQVAKVVRGGSFQLVANSGKEGAPNKLRHADLHEQVRGLRFQGVRRVHGTGPGMGV